MRKSWTGSGLLGLSNGSRLCAQADRLKLAAEHAKLQAEHDASTAELGAAQQRVDELERHCEEIRAVSDQKIAELTQLLEVAVDALLAPCLSTCKRAGHDLSSATRA